MAKILGSEFLIRALYSTYVIVILIAHVLRVYTRNLYQYLKHTIHYIVCVVELVPI